MSRYTVYILVLTLGSAAAWLIKTRPPDLARASFECGALFGLACCLALVGGVDLVNWFFRRRDLRQSSSQD